MFLEHPQATNREVAEAIGLPLTNMAHAHISSVRKKLGLAKARPRASKIPDTRPAGEFLTILVGILADNPTDRQHSLLRGALETLGQALILNPTPPHLAKILADLVEHLSNEIGLQLELTGHPCGDLATALGAGN